MLLALLGQVGEQGALLVVGEDLGSDRDLDDEVLAAGAGAVGARPALAARRAEMLGVAKVDQRIEARHRLEDDVAALAAVAAVGTAELDELLAPEADRAGPARARAEENLGLVEEMHGRALGEAASERKVRARAARRPGSGVGRLGQARRLLERLDPLSAMPHSNSISSASSGLEPVEEGAGQLDPPIARGRGHRAMGRGSVPRSPGGDKNGHWVPQRAPPVIRDSPRVA